MLESFEVVLINITIFMISEKLVTLGHLQTKVFSNKSLPMT